MNEGWAQLWPVEVVHLVRALSPELQKSQMAELVVELSASAVHEDFSLVSPLTIAAVIGHPQHGLSRASSGELAALIDQFTVLQLRWFSGASVSSSAWRALESDLESLRSAVSVEASTEAMVCEAVIAAAKGESAELVAHCRRLPPAVIHKLGFAGTDEYFEWLARLVQGIGSRLHSFGPGALLLEILRGQ